MSQDSKNVYRLSQTHTYIKIWWNSVRRVLETSKELAHGMENSWWKIAEGLQHADSYQIRSTQDSRKKQHLIVWWEKD